MAERYGGAVGLRDRGLLESAVEGAYADYFGVPLYPTVQERAARLAFALTTNHPFLDGNKRIGVLAMLVLLSLEGIELSYTQEELIALSLGIARGETDYDKVLSWVLTHG